MEPESEAELAAILAGAKAPFRVQGGGTRPIGGPREGVALATRRLSGITLYEPGALTMVARAGTPLAEIESTLAAEGQRLAFEPMDHRGVLGTTGEPTIGGVFGANVSGPRRIQAGAARDFLLGVRFVDGRGQIIRNGGRVMKNVTGYDLVKLMAGSFGTLGVLTELSFKVLPGAKSAGTVAITGLDDATAIAALSRALASPFEVSGAAHLPGGGNDAARTLIRLEGSQASVAYRAGRLQEALAQFGDARFDHDGDAVAGVWRDLRDLRPFHGREGDVWRVSVKPSDAPGIVAALPGAEAIYDWGGGLVWLLVPRGTAAQAIRAPLDTVGGHATRIRGEAGEGTFHPPPAPVAALQEGLRRKFDPRGLLNPGLMDSPAQMASD
ncbi:MAG: FAD-binding protein [Pseudomonadota bacterium]|uniref:FAD-binding protein n=1 Tax=Roseovarius TaxID=74030 RepID=UPI0022A8828B|nr:FAD-binding protein [Roseovarius sp. EGI FJ00037]MCZ0813814.1 FAD-binding protein [Roseovarius sp. EGI FJ00037]